MAASISASEHSFISPSTILISLIEADTINSKSAFANSVRVGLITNLPSIRATLTSDIGPLKGMLDTVIAAEAAKATKLSGIVSKSDDIR